MINQAAGPAQHLGSCAPGECQQQNAFGSHTVVDEPSHPAGKRSCLAASGAGDDEQRSSIVQHRIALPIVEAIEPRLDNCLRCEHVFDTSRRTAASGSPEATAVDDDSLVGAVGSKFVALRNSELESDLAPRYRKHFCGGGDGGIQLGCFHMVQLGVDAY